MKYIVGTLLAVLLVFGNMTGAFAQGDPSMSANVAEAGEQEVTITGEGWEPGLAIFILPCPGIDDLADATGDACDSSALTPVTVGADGTFEATAEWDIPAEGLIFAAGDAARTAGATARVTVGDADAGGDEGAGDEGESESGDEGEAEAEATESESQDLAETGVETQILLNVGLLLVFGGYIARRNSQS